MKAIANTFAALLLAAPLTPVDAKDAPLAQCVTLSPEHQGTRGPGNRQLLLRDGDAHYRVAFSRQCDAIARSSSIRIETDGRDNQLCPEGTSVRSRTASCSVKSVEAIEAGEFDRQAKRNRF